MGRFDHLATKPARGFSDILRWRVLDPLSGKKRPKDVPFATPRREASHELIEAREPQITWLGHASFLFGIGGLNVLVDPVLGPRVGPVKRLVAPGIAVERLPEIDVVLVTHAHYDHLDTWTIRRLGARPRYIVPLGNAPTLRAAGAEKIAELDWWSSIAIAGVTITLVPSRHWSMRVPWDRNDSLWGGFVIRAKEGAIYHSGDTAMFDGFREIAARRGPIDWACLPIGAYEPRWFMEPQHMCPEEAVEAAEVLGAEHLVAMHWGTFRLTDEPVGEPPERARAAWRSAEKPDERLWILDVGETRKLARR